MKGHEELLDMARAETGLEDFGGDSFLEGLQILTRALQQEARLNALGEQFLSRRIIDHLKQRLQIEDWYRRHPDIDDVEIEAPLIGVSLPRTGSTALSCLLAEDPNARSLRGWESAQPCPPPSTVKGRDPRIVQAEEADRQAQLDSKSALLPMSAMGPMECQELMALDFKSYMFQAFAHVPSYCEWLLLNADFTTTYLYERRTLKLLQWGRPTKPWRLKCPNHLNHLDHLIKAFPDARFVMTHRDPTEVIVSNAHLLAAFLGEFSDKVDLHYLGDLSVRQSVVGIERALAFRDGGHDARFYDIHFRAMQRDPIGQVRGLYAWLGEPVTDEFEAGMARWWRENAENREPNLHPDPGIYGLDLARIRPLFAEYTARIPEWTNH